VKLDNLMLVLWIIFSGLALRWNERHVKTTEKARTA